MFYGVNIFYCVIICILLIFYTYLLFILAGSILNGPRFKKIPIILFSIFNMFILLAFLISPYSTSQMTYLIFGSLLFVEIHFSHKDTIARTAFVVLATILHLMAIRSICTALFSVFTGLSYYEVVNQPTSLLCSTIVTAALLDIAIILLVKLLPAKMLKIINQHKEQQGFVLAWLIIFNFLLIVTSEGFSEPKHYPLLDKMQIAIAITVLSGSYVGLFFSMKTSELLGYKEKNSELKKEIYQEKEIRKSILTESIATYEFNLTKDILLSGIDLASGSAIPYSEALSFIVQKYVYLDDLVMAVAYMDRTKLLADFESGKNEIRFEYRRLSGKNDCIWAACVTNILQDSLTGDVKGITYIRDITVEKKRQIDLLYRAEHDALTGLYNSEKTKKLISNHLSNRRENELKSALFILDIDDFKGINDHLGHVFGDAVLCDLGAKLAKLFREYDIVGRIGGDEFIAFMKYLDSDYAIEQKATQICATFRQSFGGNDQKKQVISSSVGIAVYPAHGTTFEELYHHADTALYLSKDKGKNTFTIYDGESFTGYTSDRK